MFGSEERVVVDLPCVEYFTPICNKVLVHIENKNSNATTESGIILCADPDWDEGANCNVYGTVKAIPNKLLRREKAYYEFGMEHGTEMEVEVGDKVFFTRTESYNCDAITVGDDLYYLVDYPELILALRGDKRIMLNGFVLMERINEEMKSDYLDLSFSTKNKVTYGKVIEVGKPNDWYMTPNVSDPKDIKVGDTVVCKMAGISIESELFRVLGDYIYMQGRWISAAL